jgi:hypothetical protein
MARFLSDGDLVLSEDDLPISSGFSKVKRRNDRCRAEAADLLAYMPYAKKRKIFAFFISVGGMPAHFWRLCSEGIIELLSNTWTFEEEVGCEFRKLVHCWKCDRIIRGAHLYLLKEKAAICWHIGYYVHGCSHVLYDGCPWCDSCCTLIKQGRSVFVCCTVCAQIDLGRAYGTGITYFSP